MGDCLGIPGAADKNKTNPGSIAGACKPNIWVETCSKHKGSGKVWTVIHLTQVCVRLCPLGYWEGSMTEKGPYLEIVSTRTGRLNIVLPLKQVKTLPFVSCKIFFLAANNQTHPGGDTSLHFLVILYRCN